MKHALVVGLLAVGTAAGLAVAGQQPAAPAPAAAAPKQKAFKSQAEAQALQAVVQALTPDARITAAEEFLTKYADSDFKGLALFAEAQTYQEKNDYEKTIVYAERALESNPDDGTKMNTMLLLAKTLGSKTREFDLDREEKLGRVEKYSNTVLEMLKTMAKPNPQLPDERWEEAKGYMIADARQSLGMDQMVRKNYPQAITEFKAALAATKDPDPSVQLRLASAYNKSGKYDEAIPLCEQVMANTNLPPAFKQIAQAERARAVTAKGGAAAAPAQPAPAATQAAPQAAAPAQPAAPAAPQKP